MANQHPPPAEPKVFGSRDEIDKGIAKLRRRIEEVQRLKADGVPWDSARKKTAETNIRDTIREIFGPNSPEFRDFQTYRISRGTSLLGSFADHQRRFLEGVDYTVQRIEGLIERLKEKAEDLPKDTTQSAVTQERDHDGAKGRKVFLVHGHDDAARDSVARFLEKLHLEPVILREQPNAGRTIIEKFEAYADVDYAVVLLTPDDVGGPANTPEQIRPRPRQNVVFELGFFIGKLGRRNVCALYKRDLEILSDYNGVLYVQMDGADGWKLQLARELRSAGLAVDLNLVIGEPG